MLVYVVLLAAATLGDVKEEQAEAITLPIKRAHCKDGTTAGCDEKRPEISPKDRPVNDALPPQSRPTQPLSPRSSPDTWVNENDYPSLALVHEWLGTSHYMLTVSGYGKAASCEITQTSGYVTLDNATCLNVMRRARFNPAVDEKGNVLVTTYRNSVTWVIPPEDPLQAGTLKAELQNAHIGLGLGASARGKNKKPEPIGMANWIPDDPLPADWKINDSARYKVAVSDDGRVDYCVTLVTSGDARYDSFVCKHLVEKAKFSAATDKDAMPVKSFYEGWARSSFGAPQHRAGEQNNAVHSP